MSSEEYSITVRDVSKRYEIYDAPRDRLKQFALPRVRSLFGMAQRSYFREFWALNSVSFEIKRGEAFGIVGRNGSGKSTLLQIICGTLTPTVGEVRTNGRVAALLELGSGFSPDFTGRENIYLNAAVLGFDRAEIERRFDEIAAFADIGQFLDQPVKTYSSGMLVRLAFAVQVCIEPDILIVDEALAVGDALFQKRCFERMERLRSNGTTLLFVSHDQESVRTLTNRALLLRKGVMQTIGSSAETLLAYRKQLHEEENAAFDAAAKFLKEKALAAKALGNQPQGDSRIGVPLASSSPASAEGHAEPAAETSRSAALSFGDMHAEVVKVELFNAAGEPASHFDPRDTVSIVIECVAHCDIEHLNVGLRIRNKEGVKMYSWGTLNQDMAIRAGLRDGPMFWNRNFKAGHHFTVRFAFLCGLGPNLYEIQATVAQEGKPYYAEQRMLHWVDEAAFFTVTTKADEYHFGGVLDLRMQAEFEGEE
jgi:lipopolysaccharide transport system ATP-binding protein